MGTKCCFLVSYVLTIIAVGTSLRSSSVEQIVSKNRSREEQNAKFFRKLVKGPGTRPMSALTPSLIPMYTPKSGAYHTAGQYPRFPNTYVGPPSDVAVSVPVPSPDETQQEEEQAAAIGPDTAIELKKLVASQQNKLTTLQAQVSELLEELKQHREILEKEKGATTGHNALDLKIQFPEEKIGSATNEGEGAASKPGAAAVKAKQEEANGQINVYTIKTEPMQDVQDLMENVLQQEKAKTANEKAKVDIPPQLEIETPEERINNALAEIDKLEAEKAEIETDQRLQQGKIGKGLFD